MRGLAVLTGAALLSLAAPALAQERQYVCDGQATGARGERVSTSIFVSAKGEQVTATAAWDPPLVEAAASARLNAPDLMLTFVFAQPSAREMGPAGDGLIMVMAFTPPGNRSAASPQRQLAGLRVEVTIDGGLPRTVPLATNPAIEDLPMTAFRSADLPTLPPGARVVSLRLIDNKNRQVALARFDLSELASRDSLFATAWQAAEGAAQNPASCELTAEAP